MKRIVWCVIYLICSTSIASALTLNPATAGPTVIEVNVPGPQGPAGAVQYKPKGIWSAFANYSANHQVSHEGTSFVAQRPSAGIVPAEGDDWTLLAAKGEGGAQGAKGDKGDRGFQGLIGPAGPQGLEGPAGPQGPIGPKGSTGPMGYAPVKGIDYFDGATGPQGPTGPQGLRGPEGPEGPTGANSTVPGPQGPVGPRGFEGPEGPQGLIGPQGAQGIQGFKGDTGATGPKGDPGDTGPAGAAGATGPEGPQGPVGLTGPAGTTDYTALSNKPALGSAAYANIGNAAGTVAAGDDARFGQGGTWGSISGTISAQTDLQAALTAKTSVASTTGFADIYSAKTVGNGTAIDNLTAVKDSVGLVSITPGTGIRLGDTTKSTYGVNALWGTTAQPAIFSAAVHLKPVQYVGPVSIPISILCSSYGGSSIAAPAMLTPAEYDNLLVASVSITGTSDTITASYRKSDNSNSVIATPTGAYSTIQNGFWYWFEAHKKKNGAISFVLRSRKSDGIVWQSPDIFDYKTGGSFWICIGDPRSTAYTTGLNHYVIDIDSISGVGTGGIGVPAALNLTPSTDSYRTYPAIQPSNVSTRYPVLSWETPVSPTVQSLQYKVVVSSNSDFSSPIESYELATVKGRTVSDTPTMVQYQITSPLADGHYYAKVTARGNGNPEYTGSITTDFYVSKSAPVVITDVTQIRKTNFYLNFTPSDSDSFQKYEVHVGGSGVTGYTPSAGTLFATVTNRLANSIQITGRAPRGQYEVLIRTYASDNSYQDSNRKYVITADDNGEYIVTQDSNWYLGHARSTMLGNGDWYIVNDRHSFHYDGNNSTMPYTNSETTPATRITAGNYHGSVEDIPALSRLTDTCKSVYGPTTLSDGTSLLFTQKMDEEGVLQVSTLTSQDYFKTFSEGSVVTQYKAPYLPTRCSLYIYGQPTILSNGAILKAVDLGNNGLGGIIAYHISLDNGKTWSKWSDVPNVTVGGTTYNEMEPALFVESGTFPNEHIMLFMRTEDLSIGSVISDSYDSGKTWGAYRKMLTAGPDAAANPLCAKTPVGGVVKKGSRLLASLGRRGAGFTIASDGGHAIAWSDDNGATWQYKMVEISNPPNYVGDYGYTSLVDFGDEIRMTYYTSQALSKGLGGPSNVYIAYKRINPGVAGDSGPTIIIPADIDTPAAQLSSTPVMAFSNGAWGVNGNLGVGTTAPSSMVELRSTTNNAEVKSVFPSTKTGGLVLYEGGNYLGGLSAFGADYGVAGWRNSIVLTAAKDNFGGFIFRTKTGAAYSERMTLTNNGDVGIGKAPTQKLDVDGAVKATAFIGDGSQLTGISTGSGDTVASATQTSGSVPFWSGIAKTLGESISFFWDNINKRLGVGTNAPATKLHVSTSNSFTEVTFDGYSTAFGGNLNLGGARKDAAGLTIVKNGDRVGAIFGKGYKGDGFTTVASIAMEVDGEPSLTSMPGRLIFKTGNAGAVGSGSEKMRIGSTGNVGIGTAAPTEKLDVAGSIRGSTYIISGYEEHTGSFSVSKDASRITLAAGSSTVALPAVLNAGEYNVGITVAGAAASGVSIITIAGGSVGWGDAGAPTFVNNKRSKVICSSQNAAPTTTAAWDCVKGGNF